MSERKQPYTIKTSDLLLTKLIPPQVATPAVEREALLARLDEGLSRRLTLVSAPAGFGKTTLVAAWAARRDEPVGWVSLDAADSDPTRFWRYVVSACQTFDDEIGRAILPMLGGAAHGSMEPILIDLINLLAGLDSRRVLVLDDYQAIGSDDTQTGMSFLIQHLPATLHIIITTRAEPPLPLGRLRARNDLSELRADDLRFTRAEMQTFLDQALGTSLSEELVGHLERRTEGWSAGLRLIALALEGRRDPAEIEHFLSTFGGGQKHLLEYLVGDVLAAQPEATQDFMLRSAILSRFSAALCDEITGRADSQVLLNQLERDNMFLSSLGEQDGERWYRYHPLFAEAVASEARRRLSPAELNDLLGRAGRWYERRGMLTEAVEALLDGGDFENAARLIEPLVGMRAFNELHTLKRWIERLPETVLTRHPDLALIYAGALLYTMDRRAPATFELVEGPLRLAEDCWQREENDEKLGMALSFRAGLSFWANDLTSAYRYAEQALEVLGENPSDIFSRGISLLFAGMHQMVEGHVDQAEQMVMEARAISEATQDKQAVLASMLVHAEICTARGQNHQAAQLYQQVIAQAIDQEDPSDRPNALVGLGRIQYEWNEVEAAREAAQGAIEAGRELGDERLVVEATLLLARVEAASGHVDQAHALLGGLLTSPLWPRVHRRMQCWQARLSIAAGDLASARRTLDALARSGGPVEGIGQELEDLTLARLLIATGDPRSALVRVERWRQDAARQWRGRSEIEALIVMAMAQAGQGEAARARETLAEALDLAQPGDQRRLFLDEGEPVITLLKAILDEHDEPYASYARVLLHAAMSAQLAAPDSAGSGLIEPLSAQERRVLRLLAAGLSNADIADELVVSINTIKTQLKSIYHKLSVRSREEACDAAHDLHLV